MIEEKVRCRDCESNCKIKFDDTVEIICCPFCGSTEIELGKEDDEISEPYED
jgi:Zn finger protein HypA/HybF involved in hydrogenase expression